KQAGLTTWGPAGFLILKLSANIRSKATEFQTLQSTQFSVEALRPFYPYLIEAARARFSMEEIWRVLTDLLDEGIAIRDLRTILETMVSINGTTDADEERFIIFIPLAENLWPTPTGGSVSTMTTSDYAQFVRTEMKR